MRGNTIDIRRFLPVKPDKTDSWEDVTDEEAGDAAVGRRDVAIERQSKCQHPDTKQWRQAGWKPDPEWLAMHANQAFPHVHQWDDVQREGSNVVDLPKKRILSQSWQIHKARQITGKNGTALVLMWPHIPASSQAMASAIVDCAHELWWHH